MADSPMTAASFGGAVGPHGVYALPGRVLTPCLSNAKDHGGRTALVEFSNEGDYIATHWLPTRGMPGIVGAEFADGYNYDARVLPRKNVLLTTSFTGWNNYTREFGELAKDPEAMKQFGNSMVVWNFHTRQPKKAFQVPGAPLEIRWAWREKNNYAFTATTLASKLQTAAPWHFVTARSQPELQPILDAYGQAVDKKANPLDPTGPLNHTVRVFLIDGEGDIRNIYSSGTLDPRLILADVRTLMLETDLAHHQTRRASIVQ